MNNFTSTGSIIGCVVTAAWDTRPPVEDVKRKGSPQGTYKFNLEGQASLLQQSTLSRSGSQVLEDLTACTAEVPHRPSSASCGAVGASRHPRVSGVGRGIPPLVPPSTAAYWRDSTSSTSWAAFFSSRSLSPMF